MSIKYKNLQDAQKENLPIIVTEYDKYISCDEDPGYKYETIELYVQILTLNLNSGNMRVRILESDEYPHDLGNQTFDTKIPSNLNVSVSRG